MLFVLKATCYKVVTLSRFYFRNCRGHFFYNYFNMAASSRDLYSDISSGGEESDMDLDNDEEILKLFESEPEAEASFSGFEPQVSDAISTPLPVNKAVEITRGVELETGTKKNDKKKGTEKKVATKKPVQKPQTVAARKRKQPSQSSKSSKKARFDISNMTDMLGSFFNRFANVQIPCESQGQLSGNLHTADEPEVMSNVNNHQGSRSGTNNDDLLNRNANDVPIMGYSDIFSNNDPAENQVINVDKEVGLDLPKIFEDQTKFSSPVSTSLAEFVNNACTRKADVTKFLEKNQIPSNCKALVPPLINSEIWSYLYANIQQRDRSLQEVQKVLGQGIVPLIHMAEMLKGNQIDIAKAKGLITESIALVSNAFFEINIKRRYFIRPYVSKKFQQLCSATCPIEEQLFPKDVGKRITDKQADQTASKKLPEVQKGFQRPAVVQSAERPTVVNQRPREAWQSLLQRKVSPLKPEFVVQNTSEDPGGSVRRRTSGRSSIVPWEQFTELYI